jgi:ATP-dependent Clp protease ATP-binding subunit ClpC
MLLARRMHPKRNFRWKSSSSAASEVMKESVPPKYVAPPTLRLGSFLTKHGTNLNKLAQEGKIDPCIGRSDEIERAMQILCRRTKNNPVFIGDPGVGKTAVAEGLAWRLVNKQAPKMMLSKVVVSLDLPSMLAGTKFRGEFEERLRGVLRDVSQAGDRVILFIDELHLLSGAGSAEGAIDAANMLKPALARGQLRCMGATTTEEYTKYIEKDAALARRFQTIRVGEPSVDETIQILKGIVSNYEKHHSVTISEGALKAAASLSSTYMPTRRLPDKAIDLIDEAAAKIRMTHLIDDNFDNGDKNDNIIVENDSNDDNLVVEASHIAQVVASATGLPVRDIKSREAQELLAMESTLKKRMIGQDNAIKSIARSIRISRAGLRHHERPLGVFLLLGPSGTGKTELAKSISHFLFNDENACITIDMADYGERFNVSRLVGAPPGYVGHEEGGVLTEAIRHKPYSVILLDEFEKAHRAVSNLLLPVCDEGRLQDSHGRDIDFKNTVLILTSNIGVDEIYSNEEDTYKERLSKAKDLIQHYFAPEFVNRLDEIIVFNKLSRVEIGIICREQIRRVKELLETKSITLTVSESVEDWLTETGFDPLYGARPLKRLIQVSLLDPIATLMLEGKFQSNTSSCHIALGEESLPEGKWERLNNHESDSNLSFYTSTPTNTCF